MHTTFRQLRLFLALADTLSVTAAAKVMHVTQPTASMQLKELSDAVGMPLYEVVARKLYLTAAGKELAKTARAMSSEWESFEQYIDGLKGLTRGQLNVAIVSTAKYFVPRLLGSFCEQYPEIDIALQVLNRDGVVARLENNLDDLYIMSKPPQHLDLADEVFMSNPLHLIAPLAHRLVKKKLITLNDLKTERFILREQGSGTRMAADNHFKKHQFKPNLRLELGTNEAVRNSVSANLGLSVLSTYALTDDPTASGVAILKCQSFPIESDWHIVHPKGKKLSPVAANFKKHLFMHALNKTLRTE